MLFYYLPKFYLNALYLLLIYSQTYLKNEPSKTSISFQNRNIKYRVSEKGGLELALESCLTPIDPTTRHADDLSEVQMTQSLNGRHSLAPAHMPISIK